jgi:hypothetical protein
VGPEAYPDAKEKKNNFLCLELNPGLSAVANRFSD